MTTPAVYVQSRDALVLEEVKGNITTYQGNNHNYQSSRNTPFLLNEIDQSQVLCYRRLDEVRPKYQTNERRSEWISSSCSTLYRVKDQ